MSQDKQETEDTFVEAGEGLTLEGQAFTDHILSHFAIVVIRD